MFFEEAQIDTQGKRATGADAGYIEQIKASFRTQKEVDNTDSFLRLEDRAYVARIDAIEKLTGTRLHSPYDTSRDFKPATNYRDAYARQNPFPALDKRRETFEAEFAALADQFPELALPDRSVMEADMSEQAKGFEAAEADSLSRDGAKSAMLLGRIGGAMTDPINLLTLPFGGGAKTVVGATAKGAVTNATAEAAMQPIIQGNRKNLDLDYGLKQGAQNVAFAGIGGGVFEGGGKAVGLGVQRLRAGRAAKKVKAEYAPDEIAESPVGQQAEAAVEANAQLDAINPYGPQPAAVRAHEAQLTRAANGEPILTPEQGAPRPKVKSLPPEGLSTFRPDELIVDAKRFQFKSDGDADGVTERLRDVTQWDPLKAGMLVVWRDVDGKTYVADGHQRSGLARRLAADNPNADIQLYAHVLDAADGVTAKRARAAAAIKNIAEGTGTAIDAAKILRADPALLDASVSRNSAMVRQASDMMALTDDAFMMVVNEIVPESFGAVVGRMAGDTPDLQNDLMKLLAETDPANVFQAESILRQAMSGPVRKETQSTLFGDEVVTRTLFKDKARILDSAVRRLRRDQKVNRVLVQDAEKIQADGRNTLDTQGNQERLLTDAQTETLLIQAAHKKGAISDALNSAAENLADGWSLGRATREFADALSDAISRDGFDGLVTGNSKGGDRVGADGRVAEAADEGLEGNGIAADGLDPDADVVIRDPNTDDMFGFGLDLDTPEGRLKQADALEANLGEPPAEIRMEDGRKLSADDVEAELAQDRAMIERLKGCVI